jgi:alkaline phosphatase D
MYVSELKNALPYLFKAKITPFLWGVHGIGKTTAIEQVAAEGGHKLFTLALGNVEIPDILGIMDFEVDPKTGKRVSSKYMMPEFFKTLFDFAEANPDKYAILFLDELNHARKDVLSPVFQMAISGSLHTYKFPTNVRIVAAANPPTDDYAGVLNIRNAAFNDRFCHIKIEPNAKGWLNYAAGKVNDDIHGFITDSPDQLRVEGQAFSVDTFCRPSERSWEMADRLYKLDAPRELIYGMVGTTTGVAFYSWMETNKAKQISGQEILEYTKETQKRVLALVKDGKWAEVQKCVDNLQSETAKRTKELHEAYEKGDKNTGFCTDSEKAAVVKFMLDMPDEVFMSAFQVLSQIECRYICYPVFNDDSMAARMRKVVEQLKKNDAKAAKAKK